MLPLLLVENNAKSTSFKCLLGSRLWGCGVPRRCGEQSGNELLLSRANAELVPADNSNFSCPKSLLIFR